MRWALAFCVGWVVLATVLILGYEQERELKPLERPQAAQKPPTIPARDKERADQIAQCEAAGGVPVVIAGVVLSRGIGCAQPLGM
jgi:hypothetical protein